MKNIHVLPTKGLSRLVKGETTGRLLLHDIYGTSTDRNETQNIYITSDEEIKEGDWVYSEARNTLFKIKSKATTSVGTLLIEDDVIMPLEINEIDCKKIILATDVDLIKDGVQAIDDEFLEWFVKNPGCEEVIINFERYEKGVGLITSDWRTSNADYYKIIIPKEEHLQGAILKLTPKSDLEPNPIFFSNERKEMLKLCPNGDIFVHGRLAENDKEVVDALREFLRSKTLI